MTNLRQYDAPRAAAYEARRAGSPMWTREAQILAGYLSRSAPGQSVVDVPVGTGRFAGEYDERGLLAAGVDLSAEMLRQAGAKPYRWTSLQVGDIRSLAAAADWVVCVRLLNWLDPADMTAAVVAVGRCARQWAVIGIRHSVEPEPLPESGTQTHHTVAWHAALAAAGLVDVRRELVTGHPGGGYWLYLCKPVVRAGPVAVPGPVDIVAHSTAGKTSFCREISGRWGAWTILDMEMLVKIGQWHGRPGTLSEQATRHGERVVILSNAHKDPRPAAGGIGLAVFPPLDDIEANQARRRSAYSGRVAPQGSADAACVGQWRETMAGWVSDARVPVAQSFREAMRYATGSGQ